MSTLSQPDSPGGLPPRPPAPPSTTGPKRGRGGLLAISISVLALLLAIGATAVAWRALDQAKDAKDIALGRASVPTVGEPSAPPPTATGPSEPTTDGSTPPEEPPRSPGQQPEIDGRTVYEPKYTNRSLTLSAECNYSMYADLDEPKANVDQNGHDLRFTKGCGNEPSSLRLGEGVDGSEAAKPGMTPKDCKDAIDSAPIANEAKVPVRKGSLICVSTNYHAARTRGDQWRMVLVEIVAVGNDGATTIQATAWNIPG